MLLRRGVSHKWVSFRLLFIYKAQNLFMNLLKSLAAVSSITMLSRILGFVRDTIICLLYTSDAADE